MLEKTLQLGGYSNQEAKSHFKSKMRGKFADGYAERLFSFKQACFEQRRSLRVSLISPNQTFGDREDTAMSFGSPVGKFSSCFAMTSLHLCTNPPPFAFSPTDIIFFFLFAIPEGCPGLCNGNGRCTLDMNGWRCVCQLGWRGAGCATSMETACGDGKDNDGGRTVTNRAGVLTASLNLPAPALGRGGKCLTIAGRHVCNLPVYGSIKLTYCFVFGPAH